MARSDVLELLTTQRTQNDAGVWGETLVPQQIFCKVESVTRAEFFEGGRSGLNPEFKFTVFSGDYNGEDACRYRGKTYGIYRTYHTDRDTVELYVERKSGLIGE